MAADVVFGTDFNFSFTALRGETEFGSHTLVSARLYSTAPTDAEKIDHTNALGTALQYVTSWTAGVTNEKLIGFAQIQDPNLLDSDPYEVYYIVVSHKFYSATNQTEVTVVPLNVFRSAALRSRFGLAAAQVYEFESELETLKGDTWVNTKISRAEKVLKDYLRDRDVQYSKIEPEEFQNLLAYQALILISLDLQSLDVDVWKSKLEYYDDKFTDVFSKMKFRYDYNNDDDASPVEVKESGVIFLGR